MKSFLSLIVITFAFGLAMAQLYYRGNSKHPDYPNQCYYKDLELPIAIGETVSPQNRKGVCQRVHCRPDFVVEILACTRRILIDNATCEVQRDYSLPYPDCCDKLVCQDSI